MVTIATWFGRAHDISLFPLHWHFISGRESYLVCNRSITNLKKSFKLTSRPDSYPAKWPTEAMDYQKIKKDIIFCVKLKLNKTEQSIGYTNLSKCPPFFCLWMLFLFINSNNEKQAFLNHSSYLLFHWPSLCPVVCATDHQNHDSHVDGEVTVKQCSLLKLNKNWGWNLCAESGLVFPFKLVQSECLILTK